MRPLEPGEVDPDRDTEQRDYYGHRWEWFLKDGQWIKVRVTEEDE